MKSEVPVVNALVAIVKHGAERSSASDGDVGDGEGSVMCGVELAFVDRVLHGGGWIGQQQGESRVSALVVNTRCEQDDTWMELGWRRRRGSSSPSATDASRLLSLRFNRKGACPRVASPPRAFAKASLRDRPRRQRLLPCLGAHCVRLGHSPYSQNAFRTSRALRRSLFSVIAPKTRPFAHNSTRSSRVNYACAYASASRTASEAAKAS